MEALLLLRVTRAHLLHVSVVQLGLGRDLAAGPDVDALRANVDVDAREVPGEEAAYRLGITRVTSTDFVRQTMRAFFSEEFMPSIHYSSFEAAAGLREPEQAEDPVIAGFLEQTRNVLVGVRASIERALEEGWSMVLEGVHLVPGMLPRIEGALVVQCVLAIDDEEEHSTHFMVREAGLDGLRPHTKYLDRLDDIRRVQDHIVRRAKRHHVPVIANADLRTSIDAVLELVLASVEQVQRV